MCRETVHPPNYVEHEKGSTERYHKARRRHNQTHESGAGGYYCNDRVYTWLAIGDAKSCSGMGALARPPLSLGGSSPVAWNLPQKTCSTVILGDPVHF